MKNKKLLALLLSMFALSGCVDPSISDTPTTKPTPTPSEEPSSPSEQPSSPSVDESSTVVQVRVLSIEVLTAPTKLTYKYGETLDITGGVIKVTKSNETTENVNLTSEMVSGYDANKLGKQTLTVTYETRTTTLDVTVEDFLSNVSLSANPSKLSYNVGDDLDLTGAKLDLTMASGASETIDVTEAMVSGYDKEQLGKQTVVVTYQGKEVSFEVTVGDFVESISVKTNPTKTTYKYGEELDLTGAKLNVNMGSDEVNEVDITSAMVSGYNKNKLGTQTLTVKYDGKEITFEVTVIDVVSAISVISNPTKTTYKYGESIDVSGTKIEVEKISGEFEDVNVTADMISGFNPNQLGEQNVKITYNEQIAYFRVNVVDYVESIALQELEYKKVYYQGESFDVTGLVIDLDMASDATNDMVVSLDMISGYNPNILGKQTITITYEGKTTSFDVEVKENLCSLPGTVSYVEDLPTINVGDTLQLNLRADATAVSSAEAIATIDENGLITAHAYGKTTIKVSSGEEELSYVLVVRKDYAGKQIVTQEQLTATQGTNNLYAYMLGNGDIEGDLENGIKGLVLHDSPTGEGSYWNGTSFVGPNHFGGAGTSALAFKAEYDGNYTVDYAAWLDTGIRKNSEYMTWDVDGFTTGIAKKDKDGNITLLVSNVGTKESIVNDATRYQMGTYTVDLLAGEELLVFMASNGNGACDEVFTDIVFITNSTVIPQLYTLPSETASVEGLPTINVGSSLQMEIREGATVTSSNQAVATVDADGTISAVGYGSTVITVNDAKLNETKSFTLVVRRDYTGKTIVTQEQLTAVPCQNGLSAYRMDNGDIEGDLENGVKGFVLYEAIDGNYWNGTSFVGPNHFGGKGAGALAFKAEYDGNYTVDYAAWLLDGIRNNPDYMNWNVDGFTTGIAKKDKDGNITLLVSNVGTKESIVNDATRYQMGTYTVDLLAGEELLVFMASNGNGDCDEVYTDIVFVTNSTVIPELYTMPEVAKVEDLPTINVGQELQLTIRQGATVTSSNQAVATVDADGTISAVGHGSTVITVNDAKLNETKSFTLVVRKDYTGKTIVTQEQLTAVQGTNNLYAYAINTGDIETDLAEGIKGLTLHGAPTAEGTYWDGTSFVGPNHFGGAGTSALAFKAEYDGNYTVDYAAWLLDSLRKNSEYMTWDVDGFSTGIAKKDKEGNITLLVSNVGTKESVVNDATRYQMGTYTVDLLAGEELLVFMASNGNGACDEVFTDIIFTTNSTSVSELYTLPQMSYVEDLPTMNIGGECQLTLRTGATATSSNQNVATVDADGTITAVGYGSTVITVNDSKLDETKSFTLVVRRDYTGKTIVTQEQLTAVPGQNGLSAYRMDNGDIDGDLENGVKGFVLYEAINGNYWNNTSFVGPNHFGGSGAGAVSFKAEYDGNYTVDYAAWLETGIRKNGEYMTWDVDGFTTGIAKKDKEGNITLLVSNVGTKESVVNDATRYQMGTYTVDLLAGEELLVFMASNGNGSCDEVFTDIVFITNSTIIPELYTMPEVAKVEDLPTINVGQELQLAIRQGATVISSNQTVATVDADGTISAVGYGSTVITVNDAKLNETKSFTLVVRKDYTGKTIVTQEQLTAVPGQNGLSAYRMDNGDIEGDLENGVKGFVLYEAIDGNYWNGTSFVGPNHFGGKGAGAVAFKAEYDGNYTVDYAAWLDTGIRKNSEYMTWDVDGFTTGIAKKDKDGNITLLVSNVGTKESIVNDATRYQMGTYTVDLLAGEELLVFMASNGNGSCDEVFTDIVFITNSTVISELYTMPEVAKVEDLPTINVGQELQLAIRQGATVTSSNQAVATVDADGTISAIGYGSTVITVNDAKLNETKSFTLVVRKDYTGKTIVTQEQLTATQGTNNLYAYMLGNGDIEGDLENGVKGFVLHDSPTPEGTYWNGSTFVGPNHFGGGAAGALAFKAEYDGNYTVDYAAWLETGIRKNGEYMTWDVDGFTTGIAKKDKEGNITLLVSNVGTKESVVNDATRYQMGTYTVDLLAGEELLVFMASNGNGACDEVFTDIIWTTNSVVEAE